MSHHGLSRPLIRRHDAAVKLIQIFSNNHIVSHDPSHYEDHFFTLEPPPDFTHLVQHANDHILTNCNDYSIKPRDLWCAFHRRYTARIRNLKPTSNHHCLYIQTRHASVAERRSGKLRRVKPLSEVMLSDDDSHLLSSNVIIELPVNLSAMYHATDLHCCFRGSIAANDLPHHDIILHFLEVKNQRITPKLTEKGICTKDDVTVTYSNSLAIRRLGELLPYGSLPTFHHDLTIHMLSRSLRGGDKLRAHLAIDPTEPTLQANVQFGYKRCQPDTHPATKVCTGVKLPTINVKDFTYMKPSLQQSVLLLMETATRYVKVLDSLAFSDHERTAAATVPFNDVLGFPQSISCFEYVHIVLTRNTRLNKHIDTKNDHRSGYNHTVVYCFYQVIHCVTYRVSVIMTTCYTVGAALEKIAAEKEALNQRDCTHKST